MNAILFKKDGTFETVKDVVPSTYLDRPIYVSPAATMKWENEGTIPCGIQHMVTRQRFVKQIESADYAVFLEE